MFLFLFFFHFVLVPSLFILLKVCVHVLVLHDFISMCFFCNYLSTCILVNKSKSIKIKSKTLSKVQTIHSPIIFNKHVFLWGFNVRMHCLWTYDTNLLKKDCTKNEVFHFLSVNVTKSAVFFGCGHIYWRNT